MTAWLKDADLTTAMLDRVILYRAYLRDADLTRAHVGRLLGGGSRGRRE
jgi:uncharacterized protein YjbI with pentapeptide repeats